jgi:hypothetical protein
VCLQRSVEQRLLQNLSAMEAMEDEYVTNDISEASEFCVEEACCVGDEHAPTPPAASTLSEPSTAVEIAKPSASVDSSTKFKAQGAGGQDQSTQLEVMWQRLAGRGQSVAERMNIDMHKGAVALECHTREESLIRAFRALDIHNTGSLGANAMRALVVLDDPEENAKQVP